MNEVTAMETDIRLIEAMRASRREGIRHLPLHMERLNTSAQQLGFAIDVTTVRAQLGEECAALSSENDYRLRLTVGMDGNIDVAHAPLAPIENKVVDVLLSYQHGFQATRSDDRMLLHKTTRRETFDRAWQQAHLQGAFDMLFFNERGELTEGGRSNVFVKLNGAWYTPPVTSGLLPGIMRRAVLDDPAWSAFERVMYEGDLMCADAIFVCNSLRGTLPATVIRN